MERDPPKKKKKYVPVSKVTQQKVSETFENRPATSTFKKLQELQRGRFDYTFEEIINHLLARLLPNSSFTIKLSQKLIFGQEEALDNFIAKLDDNIKYTTGVTLALKGNAQKQDIEYMLKEQYRGKLFNSRLIELSVGKFFEGTKYERQYDAFLAQFYQPQKRLLYVRLNKQHKNQYLQSIHDKASVQNEQQEQLTKRGNRTAFKKEILKINIDSDALNLNDMYKFFSKSQKLDRSDLNVTKNKNCYDEVQNYTISLMSYQGDRVRKIQGFNFYFRHQNFVLLPSKDCKHKQQIVKQYGNIDEQHLKSKVLKGYRSSKWEDKSLIYKIRTGSITNRRTNYTNQYFEAIHLVGLLPTVKCYIEKIESAINEVPLDDIHEQVFIQFEDRIKDSIRNDKKIQNYVHDFIQSYMKQYEDICQVDRIKFPLRGVKINLRVKINEEEHFEHVRQNMQKVMTRYISEQKINVDFIIDSQFISRLEQQGVLVVDHKEKQFTYLASSQELEKCMQAVQKTIQQFQLIGEQTLEVVGLTKKLQYQDLINQIKSQNKQFLQILVTEPTTADKVHYKIVFYGPRKKNDRFVQQVKRRIQKRQSQMGQHHEFIDQKVGKLIVEDDAFQKKIAIQYGISLVVQTRSIDAKLQIFCKKTSQVYILKTHTLLQLPTDTYLFVEDKVIIQEFREKFFERFKTIVKRYKQDKWIQEHQKTRNYQFMFKYNCTVQEIFSEAVRKHKGEDKTLSIALLMPKKGKKQWLRKIFDILTFDKDTSQIQFKIYILELDKNQKVDKIVDIPQHLPFVADTQEIVVQWFCDKDPYSRAANTKINDAIANHLTQVILDKQDITCNNNTHVCDLSKKVIAYLSGGNYQQIPFFIQGGTATFTYKSRKLTFPQTEYNKLLYHQKVSKQNKFYLSMPYYIIDLVKNKQINIFTNFERNLTKNQSRFSRKQNFKGVIKAFYNQKMTHLIFNFKQLDSRHLLEAVGMIKQYTKDHWNKQTFSIRDIQQVQFEDILKQRIVARAQEHSLKYELDPKLKFITVESFQRKDIENFKSIMDSQIEYLINISKKNQSIKVPAPRKPQYWVSQQKQIQLFQVLKNSKQFVQVQSLFGNSRKIISLKRIQNKIIYQRFIDELEHLTYINSKQPQQLKLFHGTGKTSPEVIWADQQDGFNINYSSDTNLLGRGIYFAQRAQYSFGYASNEGIFNNQQTFGMFLCTVIVGDSLQMKMSQNNRQVIDTKLKPNGIRYESSKGIHPVSQVYVVYKNRRAYPLYFIRYS